MAGGGGSGFVAMGTHPMAAARANGSHAATEAMFGAMTAEGPRRRRRKRVQSRREPLTVPAVPGSPSPGSLGTVHKAQDTPRSPQPVGDSAGANRINLLLTLHCRFIISKVVIIKDQ